ncbi:hypothetical protein BLNAU_8564 [Blattamonas nauphoetae]|uniref:Uncharacterized protein n=1 Tax=Blattamonas nauphoetae TaxID=2049346 RepID=A0ABQ9XYD5_9EUKA|nr:hypothetical protein BLNAU_8564 [Blattamonas nauphoetae]
MEMLNHLFCRCTPQFRLKLIEAQLIPQIIISLKPQSPVVRETVLINASLLHIIASSLDLATQEGLTLLKIEPNHGLQTVFQTVHSQVLVPSKSYIHHLYQRRFSITDTDLLSNFLNLISRLLQISPYYQRTMDFVLNMPIILTIPSCLTFFDDDADMMFRFEFIDDTRCKWNKQAESIRRSETILIRSLRMEGFDDVSEQRLLNCEILTEALDPLEMLHKTFAVANHEPNWADMLATCFALQCCHAGSIKGIGTTSDAASQANLNSTSLNLENRHTLSTRNECAMSERAVTRSVAGQSSASCVSWLDGSGNSVDDVKVAVGLVEGSFGCWEAGDAHRATPHRRQPASPASPHGTHSRMMREVVGRLHERGQLDIRDGRIQWTLQPIANQRHLGPSPHLNKLYSAAVPFYTFGIVITRS